MANFIKVQVLSGQDVILNKKTIVSVNRVLSDHTGSITSYNEIRLNNGSKWHTHLSMEQLIDILNK